MLILHLNWVNNIFKITWTFSLLHEFLMYLSQKNINLSTWYFLRGDNGSLIKYSNKVKEKEPTIYKN